MDGRTDGRTDGWMDGLTHQIELASVAALQQNCKTGAQRGAGTHDPKINTLMLYQLSYRAPVIQRTGNRFSRQ